MSRRKRWAIYGIIIVVAAIISIAIFISLRDTTRRHFKPESAFFFYLGVFILPIVSVPFFVKSFEYHKKYKRLIAALKTKKRNGEEVITISQIAEETDVKPPHAIDIIQELVDNGYFAGYINRDTWKFVLGSRAPSKKEKQSQQNYCPSCGRAIQPNWKMCPHCNTDLEVHP